MLFIEPTFWLASAAIYALLVPRYSYPLTLRFGLLNCLALALLLGWEATLTGLLMVTVIWVMLNILSQFSSSSQKSIKVTIGFITIFIAAIPFIIYKLNHGNPHFISLLERLAPWSRPDVVLSILATLSFSYVFLRFIDLIVSVTWENSILINPLSLMGYIFPFHMLLSGPINVYQDHLMIDQKSSEEKNFSNVLSAVNEIATGLCYKFVIAEGLRIYVYGINQPLGTTTWLEAAFLTIYLFFDFGGYSKVAVGLGRLFGIPTPNNFSIPFFSFTMTELWTRWHSSLGDFIKRNIFVPLQLNLVRKFGLNWAKWTNAFALIVSFGLVGVWHRFTLNYLFYGISLGIVLSVEKIFRDKWPDFFQKNRSPIGAKFRFLGPVYVFTVLTTTFFFIANELIGV